MESAFARRPLLNGADDASVNPHIRGTLMGADGSLSSIADLATISDLIADDRFVWLDVVDPTPEDLRLLHEEFDLHPLALEDAASAHQRAKIEPYDGFWFVIAHPATYEREELRTNEVAIFAGAHFVVTARHGSGFAMEEVERRWQLLHNLQRDSGAFVYTILDTIVDGYGPIVERFEQQTDDVADDLLSEAYRSEVRSRGVLVDILRVKKALQRLRYDIAPLQDVIARITRGDIAIFGSDEMAYYRDVADHVRRVMDRIDSLREIVTTSLSINASVASNRQAEISKQLTLIATVFLPLSFLTGFFGQNFDLLIRDIAGPVQFWVLGVGLPAITAAGLLLYFRRKRWI